MEKDLEHMLPPWARPTWAEVDLGAISHNIRIIRQKVGPHRSIMAVVKADAYGHGAKQVARAALQAGADWLGVAFPEEGAELRDAGIGAPIVVLGPVLPFQLALVLERDLAVSVSSMDLAEALEEQAAQRGLFARVHVKVDTGMGRLGVPADKAPAFLKELGSLGHLKLEGLYTHLATADEPDSDFAREQLRRFLEVDRKARENGINIPFRHAANSAGLISLEELGLLELVRPGLMLYGCFPNPGISNPLPLRPALAWKTRVAHLRDLEAGQSVSYGRTFVAAKPMRVAVLPLGYGDGLPRSLSNRGQVLVRGSRAPILGIICMDMTIVDVTRIQGVELGDEVVLLGRQAGHEISAEEMARWADTISYEILCGVSKRVPRVYLEESKCPGGGSGGL
jgi:alanine racemase